MRPSCRRNAKSAVTGETSQRSCGGPSDTAVTGCVAHTSYTTVPVYVWVFIFLVSDSCNVSSVAGGGGGGPSNEITSFLSVFDSRATGGWSKLAGRIEFIPTNSAGGEKALSIWR